MSIKRAEVFEHANSNIAFFEFASV